MFGSFSAVRASAASRISRSPLKNTRMSVASAARRRLGPQLLDRLDDAGHLVALGDDVPAVGVELEERAVADLDGEGPARDLDDRHLAHEPAALVGAEVARRTGRGRSSPR